MRINKRGIAKDITEWMIAIAFAGLILAIVMNWSNITKRSTTEQLKCGGIGITDGQCIADPANCAGVPVKGLCENDQWCCETERVTGAKGSPGDGSKTSGQSGTSSCTAENKFSITSAGIAPDLSANFNSKPYLPIYCVADKEINPECLTLDITVDGRKVTPDSCRLVEGENLKVKVFFCPKDAFSKDKTYTISCIATGSESCCVAGGVSAQSYEFKP